MKTTQAAIEHPDLKGQNADRRAAPRFKTIALGAVSNITQGAKKEAALLLDMSRTGMRIETVLAVSPGDALRIDIPDSTLLAEAIYCESTPNGTEVGLKLRHFLRRDDLLRCVEPKVWGEILSE